jgi:3-dehydroquinate dehydratase-2
MRILVLNGPNLQLLGTREPDIYGSTSLADVNQQLASVASELGVEVECRQSNHEGELIDWFAEARETFDGVIINPAGYTHTSIALHDAIVASETPCIEIHISNVHAREAFRQHSYTAPACSGQIVGLGTDGYEWALRALVRKLKRG